MITIIGIRELLSNMTNNTSSNIKKIIKTFGNLKYKDFDNQSLLHILVDNKYDEEKCFLAIQSLLKAGLNPNLEADFNYNFIQTALYAGYSENFILNIIGEALKYGLDVNHVDEDKDTIVHTAIYSDDYLGEVEKIYELLCSNGYDSSKRDHDGRNLIEAMIYQKQYSKDQIERFKTLFYSNSTKKGQEKPIPNNTIPNETKQPVAVSQTKEQKKTMTNNTTPSEAKQTVQVSQTLSTKEIAELEKFGKLLNAKNYVVAPTIGREKELKNLMITLAQNKKNPLIVGESGVGKTALVDELVYRIKTGQVPRFLQGKIILEVNPNEVVAGCEYTGQFEENITKLMKLCEEKDIIIFIDEIHTIYGIGATKQKDNDMAAMLKYYIDRSSIKVIGTTTEDEYDKYFAGNALKRRFDKIRVQEPTTEILYKIIDKTINDYSTETGISFKNEELKSEIVNVILESTEKRHRVYNDTINNPDLAISIVDKAFAFVQVYDSEFITKEHFIESFEFCDRIYDSVKTQAIEKLRTMNDDVTKPDSKIFKIDFKRHKK